MSTKQEQRTAARRDEEARLNAGHLGAPTRQEDDDEDWGDVPPRTSGSKRGAADDLDRELEREEEASSQSREESETVNQTREAPPAAPQMDPRAAMQQLDEITKNVPAFIKALESELMGVEDERSKLDEKEKAIKSRINFFKKLSGQTVDEDDDFGTPAPRTRRGGRRRAASSGDGAATATTTGRKGGKGKRHQNDQTLKEAIVKAMANMPNFSGFVNDITKKVTGEQGYKTTSAKPTNTIRIQMYRLEKDGKVKQNDDGSYTLRKSVAHEVLGRTDGTPASN